jgi:hypothetical protein
MPVESKYPYDPLAPAGLPGALERSVRDKAPVQLSWRVGPRKIASQTVVIRELFRRGAHWVILTESGMTVPVEDILGIRKRKTN